jgi:hypothetical protein
MIKSMDRGGMASVTFTLDEAVGAERAAICGEWNNWSPDRDIMERVEGRFMRTVRLEAGRTYRFRYLLDGHRWENDWSADWYVPNGHGEDDSMLDLTSPPPEAGDADRITSARSRSGGPAQARANGNATKSAGQPATGKSSGPASSASKKAASKAVVTPRRAKKKTDG